MQGHRVLLLEKERFPRYQIGESLLPSTIHGICVLLGVRDELDRAGFMRKRGGTFRWGSTPEPWTFAFALSQLMEGPTSHAYQVERSKFDQILLDNAARNGVDVRQEHTVTDVREEGDRVTGVSYADPEGYVQTATARFVGAAAGNTSHLYRKLPGTRDFSPFFRNVALFCYFEGGKRLAPPDQGNILCAAFDDGWFWYIPLTQDLTSVGAVIARDKAHEIKRKGHEVAMRDFIAACPMIADYLADASRVTEGQYGQFRVRKDFSYCNSAFWRPGMFAVGDAACFVDPVFSSGVHLATYSALLAARSVNSCLRDGLDESTSFAEFERRYRREYAVFYRFLTAFYDMNKDESSYFWSARTVTGSTEPNMEAFIRLVGGVSTSGEPLFGDGEEFRRTASSISGGLQAVASAEVERPGSGSTVFGTSEDARSLWQSSEEVRVQARGPRYARPTRRSTSGLSASEDGFHWCVPRTDREADDLLLQ